MTTYALLSHLLFGLILLGIASAICRFLEKHPFILDMPNERSSHQVPTPKSGGIAIVITFISGIIAISALGEETLINWHVLTGFSVSAVLIAFVSLLDDLSIISSSLMARLLAQSVAALSCIAFGIVITEVSLPWIGVTQLGLVGAIVTFLWIIGLTNAYNFMDGLNGIAGGTAIIVGVFFSLISFQQGSNFAYLITYSLVAGSLGFLFFNFPKARLFMGDVGSAFLGFVFATLAIVAALYDHSHTSLFVMPLLLFHFVYETFFTFIRRFVSGENVFEAHRTHFYQLLNQLGWSHTKVTLFYWGIAMAQGLGAVWMVNIQGGQRMLVFVPFLVFQIVYSLVVIKKARKAGIL